MRIVVVVVASPSSEGGSSRGAKGARERSQREEEVHYTDVRKIRIYPTGHAHQEGEESKMSLISCHIVHGKEVSTGGRSSFALCRYDVASERERDDLSSFSGFFDSDPAERAAGFLSLLEKGRKEGRNPTHGR